MKDEFWFDAGEASVLRILSEVQDVTIQGSALSGKPHMGAVYKFMNK